VLFRTKPVTLKEETSIYTYVSETHGVTKRLFLGGLRNNMPLRLEVALPGTALSEAYYTCRYACLREPLGFPEGAERLKDDEEAIHAWWEADDGEVVAVGRIHRIPDDSDGSQSDHAGPDAAVCPAFTPLAEGGQKLRPAVQIRQMGTRNEWRRQGLASGLVIALEGAAISHWGAKSGWLQSRIEATSMYAGEDWTLFGDEYDVKGIGSHFSMWKILDGEDSD
jgi:predicted GNAT family N-acyltransferase